jgi:mono/diheme cytochrome c family protein
VAYGGGCDTGIVRSTVTVFSEEGPQRSAALEGASLVVDGVDPGRGSLYLAAAAEPAAPRQGGSDSRSSGVRRIDSGALDRDAERSLCVTGEAPIGHHTPVTAVAAFPSGGYVAQLRDPLRLWISRDGERGHTVDLSGGRVQHMGHAVFHEAAGTGATCAGCHPEGGDDGHLWSFDVGPRRTQTLTGGILDTAPFHWSGDVPGTTDVMEGTFVGRMGGGRLFQDEMAAFNQWVDALPAVPGPSEEAGAVARGEAVFEASSCGSCHSGPLHTNNENADVGTGGPFQVPSLYELVYRAPYMHDATVPTLEELLTSHGEAATRSEAERRDLAAFLRSL